MGELTDPVPPNAQPVPSYVAELERLPDGSLRACLYRDGQPVHASGWPVNDAAAAACSI